MKLNPAISRPLLYGVLALCLVGFAYVQGRADQRDQEALQQAQTLLAGHTGYLRMIDSLRGAEAHYVGLEGYYRRLADSLGRSENVANPAAQPPTMSQAPGDSTRVPPYGTRDSLRVIFLGRALDACDESRAAADSALARCAARGDSLEASLRGVLAIKSCHLLFLKCPSRTAFFVVGALAGALVEHRLSH